MRSATMITVFCLMIATVTARGATDEPATQPVKKPPTPPKYQLLRYQEDYSALGDGPRENWLDFLKHRPLVREDLRLTVGGQARFRYELKSHEVFGSGRPGSDEYFLHRYRIHADLQYRDWLRVFVEGKFAYAEQRDRRAPLLFQDKADLQNAFVDITPWRGVKNKLVFRVGRQELLYGKQRLVSSFDWANVMRTFDGARVLLTLDEGDKGKWQIDGWWTRLVQINNDGWNDTDENIQFFGIYATHNGPSKSGYDIYALGFSGDERTSANGRMGTDTRMTFGARLWCKQLEPWDFEVETAWQTGRFSGQADNAWMATVVAGYTFKDLLTRPRLSVGYDYASGDDNPTDNHVSTFNQLFPLGHAYFGYIDVVGRQNIHAAHVRIDLLPLKKTKVWLQFYSFWLDEKKDALYNAGGAPIRRDATGGSGTYVGSELDIVAKYQLDRHSSILAGYSHFWPGQFIEDTGSHKAIDFVYLQYQFTF